MCCARVENKTSKVKRPSRKIANTLLIREKGKKTFDSRASAEKLVNVH